MDSWLLWFLVGLALILSEFFLTAVFLVFFGVAAWAVALLSFVGLIESPALQLFVFAVVSLLLALSLRRVVMSRLDQPGRALPGGSDQADEFTGKAVKVLTPFNGPGASGKVEFKGAEWSARSEDELQPGDSAEIVSIQGLTLNVRRQWLTPFP